MRNITILTLKCLTTSALFLSSVACDSEPGDGGSSNGDSYSNSAYIECNGEVLVDEEFDSKEECERYRDRGPWDCQGLDMDFSC